MSCRPKIEQEVANQPPDMLPRLCTHIHLREKISGFLPLFNLTFNIVSHVLRQAHFCFLLLRLLFKLLCIHIFQSSAHYDYPTLVCQHNTHVQLYRISVNNFQFVMMTNQSNPNFLPYCLYSKRRKSSYVDILQS